MESEQVQENIDNRNKKIKTALIFIAIIALFGMLYYFLSQPQKLEEGFVCVKNDSEIYERYKNASVLIKHTFQYKVKINDKEFTIDFPDAPSETIYGTGFFVHSAVNEPNPIITNRHIIKPWEDESDNENYDRKIYNVRMKISSILTTDIEPENIQSFIEKNWDKGFISNEGEEDGEYNEGDSEEFVSSNPQNESTENIDEAKAATDIASTIEEKKYVSIDDIEVNIETVSLSFAYHNSNDEWHDCTVLKISDEENIDLAAIISAESALHYIPENAFEIDENTIIPGQKVFMIGFPLGESFAKSENGYKVQFYKGEVSRESDGVKIQYSIPSSGGASGAPIFNECGKLIAVNFGGIEKMQNLNFGILSKFVNDLISN